MRDRSLVVSDLRLETSYVQLSGKEELKKCPPLSPAVLWFVNDRERKPR